MKIKAILTVILMSGMSTLALAQTETNNHQKERENMENSVLVVYQWIAKEGKAEELKKIYADVTKMMNKNEPGALEVECFFDESSNTLVVRDLFANAEAVGFHLGTTAAVHFPSLLEVAVPGPFLFCGEVPEEMKQAALGMGLDAKFAPRQFGFVKG